MNSDNSEVMISKADVLRIIDLHTTKIEGSWHIAGDFDYDKMVDEIEALG